MSLRRGDTEPAFLTRPQARAPVPPSNEETTLAQSATRSGTPGFSVVELVVSICVMLILTAIAIPSLMRSLRVYQLNDAAARLSDMLKFTRFEAVRRNTRLDFLAQATASGWVLGIDSNTSYGTIDPNKPQQVIGGFAALVAAGNGTPPPTAISAALGGATLTTLSGSNASVTFDARGAIRTAVNGTVSTSIYVFYIGSVVDPDPGYRAVVLLPSGNTQIW